MDHPSQPWVKRADSGKLPSKINILPTGSRLLILVLINLFVVAVLGFLAYQNFQMNKRVVLLNTVSNELTGNQMIFRKSEGWGPCMNEASTCEMGTYVYKSGRIVFQGDTTKEFLLSQDDLRRFTKEIQMSGVMDKDCSGPILLDYSVEYEINIEDKTKKIGRVDTGCQDDLAEVNRLLNEYE